GPLQARRQPPWPRLPGWAARQGRVEVLHELGLPAIHPQRPIGERGVRRVREALRKAGGLTMAATTERAILAGGCFWGMQQLVRRLPGVVSTRVGSASFAPDFYESAKQAAAALPESDTSLAAERLRGIALSHRDWLMADGGRTRLRAQWRELFKTFDAVICAVMPTAAYPHDHSPEREKRRIDGKEYVYPDQLAWARNRDIAAIPTGFAPDGLPVGVQIVGPWLEDPTPLKLAELIEREFGGFVPPKMFDD